MDTNFLDAAVSNFAADSAAIRHPAQSNSVEHPASAGPVRHRTDSPWRTCRFRQRAEIRQESANQSLVTHHLSLVDYGLGRGAGVGRGLGVGVHLPVHGVGVGVGVGRGPDCAQYLPPVLVDSRLTAVAPPHTISSLPSHTAV